MVYIDEDKATIAINEKYIIGVRKIMGTICIVTECGDYYYKEDNGTDIMEYFKEIMKDGTEEIIIHTVIDDSRTYCFRMDNCVNFKRVGKEIFITLSNGQEIFFKRSESEEIAREVIKKIEDKKTAAVDALWNLVFDNLGER